MGYKIEKINEEINTFSGIVIMSAMIIISLVIHILSLKEWFDNYG